MAIEDQLNKIISLLEQINNKLPEVPKAENKQPYKKVKRYKMSEDEKVIERLAKEIIDDNNGRLRKLKSQ